MSRKPKTELKSGWTTGACATAATKAALAALWGGVAPAQVTITLPKGQRPTFSVVKATSGEGFGGAGIIKDAGDDPDVTHGALVMAHVTASAKGVVFKAGDGIGTVTKAGLPIPVGEPAINPVPRQMMQQVVEEMAQFYGQAADVTITISIPGGDTIAEKTWNPRLGIKGGLSILGTTGIVRPFSCSAWIASIHRGVDVARAAGEIHIAGCTGSTSETAVQQHFSLPDHAMMDMGDFAGGLLKYVRAHPVTRLTIGGGIGKITKLAQGAVDLHSARSQVDFDRLNQMARDAGLPDVSKVNTALEALEITGDKLAILVANEAKQKVDIILRNSGISTDVMIVNRTGKILATTDK